MSDTWYAIWKHRLANVKALAAPLLKSLPPTTEAFSEHVHRAHYQACVWMSAAFPDPPDMDPTEYGWPGSETITIRPRMLASDVSPVPVEVLQMIKCGCSSVRACGSGRWSCVSAQMSWSMFCTCHAGPDYCNEHTKAVSSLDEDDSCWTVLLLKTFRLCLIRDMFVCKYVSRYSEITIKYLVNTCVNISLYW